MPAPKKRTAPYVAVKTIHGRRAQAGEPLAFIRSHVGYSGSDCLIWPYGRYGNGYCAIIYEDTQTFAHRVMCRLAHGEPPAQGYDASHTCERGHEGCVNPRHLAWETHKQNHSRRIGVKRKPGTNWGGAGEWVLRKGEDHFRSKLKSADVLAIRADSRSYSKIAQHYGVSVSTIKHIRARNSWAHLP